MKVAVGVSNRHIHLCESDYKLLFGDDQLIKKVDLNQPGEFASIRTVTLKGNKGEIPNVRVLGPLRPYTQVEVSKTDSYKLGVNPNVATSGHLENAALITIVGQNSEITRKACIIANRHIHVDEKIRKEHNLEGIEKVSVRVNTEKPGIMENVYLKDLPNSYFEMHIDTDDANAHLLNQNDEVEIIR